MQRRVVVTGMGAITPIGHSVPDSLASLRSGRSGVRAMPEWSFMGDLHSRIAATVEGIDLERVYPRRVRRTMGRIALLSLHATEEAIAAAALPPAILANGRTGISYGSTTGSASELEAFSRPLMVEHTLRGLESNAYLRIMTHTCAANLAAHFEVHGRVQPTCSACTSSSQAVGVGFDLIRQDAADVMIVGGADEMHYSSVATLDLLMATSHGWNDRPSLSPRPFDARRDGLVVGEAAATLVLEEREHALARGAHILGEIHAYATNCGGHHMTQPDVGRMRTVMELALAQARRRPEEIEYVDAHATGTGVGDLAEARATWETFARAIPISSQKGHVGHTLGACGALEVIFALGTMREGFLAPTLNLETLDPELPPLDFLREVRPTRARLAMSNNFAFGGVNTSIVLSAD